MRCCRELIFAGLLWGMLVPLGAGIGRAQSVAATGTATLSATQKSKPARGRPTSFQEAGARIALPPFEVLADQLRKAFPPKKAAMSSIENSGSKPGDPFKKTLGTGARIQAERLKMRALASDASTAAPSRKGAPEPDSRSERKELPPSALSDEDGAEPVSETRSYPVLERRVRKDMPMSEQARTIYAQGVKAFARGEFHEAAKSFEQALTLAPGHPVVLTNLGLAEYRLEKIEKAEERLREAVANDLNAMEAWLTLGIVCSEQGKLEGAVAALSQAVLLAPDDPRPRNHLGVAFSRLEWLDAAEAQLIRALELKEDYVDGHFNLAVVYLRRQPVAVELARRHYQRALDLGAAGDPIIEEMLSRAPAN